MNKSLLNFDLNDRENFSMFSTLEQRQLQCILLKINEILLDYNDRIQMKALPGLIKSFTRIYSQEYSITRLKKAMYPVIVECKHVNEYGCYQEDFNGFYSDIEVVIRTKILSGIDYRCMFNKLLKYCDSHGITIKKLTLK